MRFRVLAFFSVDDIQVYAGPELPFATPSAGSAPGRKLPIYDACMTC